MTEDTNNGESALHVAGAVIVNADGDVLLVRKKDTDSFMQPGGKVEAGELPIRTVIRETEEEVGLLVDEIECTHLGTFMADAANHPGLTIRSDLYLLAHPDPRPAEAQAEIAELRWVDPTDPGDLEMGPLTRDIVLPLVAAATESA